MSKTVQIHVALLDEGVPVWRPVQARWIRDDLYIVLDQAYDRSTETWEFEPGDQVRCEMIELTDGPILAATRRAEQRGWG